MAKILFSGGVGAASGSVGGNVFSRNASGAYIRNKGIPTNPNTLAQQSARAALAAQSIVWRSLDEGQKQTFRDQVNAYPYIDKLGQTKTYTPFQLCGSVNGRVLQANRYDLVVGSGLPASNIVAMAAPVDFPFVTLASVAMSAAEGLFSTGISLSSNAPNLPTGTVLLIDASAPLSSGVTSPKNSDFRNLFAIGSGVPVSQVDLSNSLYEIVFGVAIFPSQNIYFRFTTLNLATGQYSPSVSCKVSISA